MGRWRSGAIDDFEFHAPHSQASCAFKHQFRPEGHSEVCDEEDAAPSGCLEDGFEGIDPLELGVRSVSGGAKCDSMGEAPLIEAPRPTARGRQGGIPSVGSHAFKCVLEGKRASMSAEHHAVR